MIKFPFLVLTYGVFQGSQKLLFIYEKNEKLIIPIFTDGQRALRYANYMEKVLEDNGDNRDLEIYSCDSKQKACDIFKILALSFKVEKVIINPTPKRGKQISIDVIIDYLST